MKKVVFLIAAVVLSLNCVAQEKYTYSEVVNVDSTAKSAIYNKVKAWTNQFYKSRADKFQFDDVNRDQISGAASLTMYVTFLLTPMPVNINYDVNIQFKDNRFKIVFDNFSLLSEKDAAKVSDKGQLNYIYKTLPDDLSSLTTAQLSDRKVKFIKKYNDKALFECQKQVAGIMKKLKEALKKPADDNW